MSNPILIEKRGHTALIDHEQPAGQHLDRAEPEDALKSHRCRA